jgi:cell division initiation protein
MKLTPLDIRHKEFRRAMRGYSDEEVDVFLDEIADEFERLFQENIDAQERIQRLQEHVAQYEGLKETLQKTLISAQQQADEVKSNSRKEGELILRDAELRARDILSESYTEKQRIQQSLISLRQVEEDFRFRFKSLLEAHLNLLNEDESSEERRRFRGLVDGVEQESGPAATAAESANLEVDPLGGTVAAIPDGEESAPVAVPPDVAPEEADVVAAGVAVVEQGDLVEALSSDPDPIDAPPPSFLTRSGTGETPFAFDLDRDDDVTDAGSEAAGAGDEAAGADELQSPVRRFLFGKKEKESDEDFFSGKKDRDFEW